MSSRQSSFSFHEEVVIMAGLNSIDLKSRLQNKSKNCELINRKKFVERTKNLSSDVCCILAALGFFLMVLENELFFLGAFQQDAFISNIIKSFLSISTLLLLVSVSYFHLVDYYFLDWRTEFTAQRLGYLLVELLLFCVHPIPGQFTYTWFVVPNNGDTVKAVEYRVDVVLALIMISRFQIFLRSFLLHLKIFHDKFQIIGRMNAVEFDLYFKIKTLTTFHPGRVLFMFNFIFIITASWYLRLTERHYDVAFDSFVNSTWCIIVTFLTIGYGDLTPVTLLGRTIVIITGLVGIASSSLLIAVLAQKLKLSKAEALVHSYISNDAINSEAKNCAARVIQKAWFAHKYENKRNVRFFLAQRELCSVVNSFKKVKLERKRRTIDKDHCIELKQRTLHELSICLLENMNELKATQAMNMSKIDTLQQNLHDFMFNTGVRE